MTILRARGEEEVTDMPSWVKILFTALGLVLLVLGFSTILAQFFSIEDLPSPQEFESSLIIGLGAALILLGKFPWSKIKIGNIELERALQEQVEESSEDYAEVINQLKNEVEKYKSRLSETEPVANHLDGHPRQETDMIVEPMAFPTSEEKVSKAKGKLLEFLENNPRVGYSISKIKTRIAEQDGYQDLKGLGNATLRVLADELLREGEVKNRISKNGGLLYQKNNS